MNRLVRRTIGEEFADVVLVPIVVPIFDRKKTLFGEFNGARVAELVDAPDLG
ncbi:uncharacterized protein METZ01_LOCUS275404, partial [marine metagenome]